MADTDPTPTPTPAPTQKPGWKTTEFWLSKIAMIIGGLLASGLITDDRWLRAFGIATVILSSLGYTYSRTVVKTTTMLLVVMLGLATLTQAACHPNVPQVISIIEDCIGQERPAIVDLIKKWTDAKPSWGEIESEALAKGVHVGGCAVHEFVNTFLTPAPGNHAPSPEEGWAANALILSYESKAKISERVVFKTPQGNL